MKKRNLALLALAGIILFGLSRAGGLPLLPPIRGGARVIIENKHTTDISFARIEADYSNTFEMSFIICDWAVLKQNQAYDCQIPPEKDFQDTKMKFTGRFTLIIPPGEFDFQLENLSSIMRTENGITVQIIDMSKPAKITILPITQIPNPKVIIVNNNGYVYGYPSVDLSAIYTATRDSKAYEFIWYICGWYNLEPNKTYECIIPYINTGPGVAGKFTGKFKLYTSTPVKYEPTENLVFADDPEFGKVFQFINIKKPAKLTILNP